jgi:anti-sigma factor RsiW
MRCAEINEMLPAYAGEGDLPLAVRRHLSRCPGCRAALAQYEEMSHALHTMSAAMQADPPVGLRAALVAIPTETGRVETVRSHIGRNKRAYAGLLVGLAGAAGAAVWASRRQGPAPA